MLRALTINFCYLSMPLLIFITVSDGDNKCFSKDALKIEGVCTFSINCLRLKGQQVGICLDRSLVKSCCVLTGNVNGSVNNFSNSNHLAEKHFFPSVIVPTDHNDALINVAEWVLATSTRATKESVQNFSESAGNVVNSTEKIKEENKTDLNDSKALDIGISTTESNLVSEKIKVMETLLKSGLDLTNDTDPKLVCGRSYYKHFPTSRIIGGKGSRFAKWPWQASLRFRKRNLFSHLCGAVLVSNFWVITAAHCVQHKSKRDLLVRLGEFDQSNENEPLQHADYTVFNIISHPQYNDRMFHNDIALIQLEKPVSFRANILPVCLPVADDLVTYINTTTTITGWGRLYPDGPHATKLQQVEIPIISNKKCKEMLKLPWDMTENILCAGFEDGGKDACEGDSGGPMVLQRSDRRWEVIGIISWGIDCAKPAKPGVYMKIVKFTEWIKDNMKQHE